jgi:hypothetical protein
MAGGCRPSTSLICAGEVVDARDEHGHDEGEIDTHPELTEASDDRGTGTRRSDFDMIEERCDRSCRMLRSGETAMTRRVKVTKGSGNIFADLGLPDAATHFLKAIANLDGPRKL